MRYKLIRELPTLNNEYRIDSISSFERIDDINIILRFKHCFRKKHDRKSVKQTQNDVKRYVDYHGLYKVEYRDERWTVLDTLGGPKHLSFYGRRVRSEAEYEFQLERFKRFKREILLRELI